MKQLFLLPLTLFFCLTSYAGENFTEQEFNDILQTAQRIYQETAENTNTSLFVIGRWSNNQPGVLTDRFVNRVRVIITGGLARDKDITQDGFIFALCHQLGIAYGGKPLRQKIISFSPLSAPAQGDYNGANACISLMFQSIPPEAGSAEPTQLIKKLCQKKNFCVRSLSAAESYATLLSNVTGFAQPHFDTPDKTVVSATLRTEYPGLQCRMDTFLAGVLNLKRPACWFKQGDL